VAAARVHVELSGDAGEAEALGVGDVLVMEAV
jgi:uncharacterized cupin superfamily protein